MATKVLKLGREVLTALCVKCSCCLASTTHCAHCHETKPIEKLCGCGTCMSMTQDYIQREEVRLKAMSLRIAAKAREYHDAA